MILCAFVGEGGHVVWVNDEGTSSFAQVFVRRPSGCRYAIVKMKDTYASLDMYEGLMVSVSLSPLASDKRAEVGIHHHYRTLDAAIMATMIMYNIGDTLDGKTQKEIDEFVEASKNCPDCEWSSGHSE